MRVEDKSLLYSIDELAEAAQWLLQQCGSLKVWLFDAQMGGGKTTLIGEVCRLLEVDEEAASPTFAIVNEYHTKGGEKVFHIDAYRLEKLQDAMNIGIGEYLESGAYCLVEWPGVLESLLPDNFAKIRIDLVSDTQRRLTLLEDDAAFIYDVK